MAFKSKSESKLSIESPESLFSDIKSKKIPGLLTQQGDLLREYVAKFVNTSDVAAQLPTGSGKTLVALLIAEWRRLKFGERVVYLCPTKQLVNQVAQQANETYGIRVVPFTGSVRAYSGNDKALYRGSQAIAVTTYSSLFNSNPFFDDPHLIVLDDAHAGEQYIADNWTIDLKGYKAEDQPLFNAICSCLRPHLDSLSFMRLVSAPDSSSDMAWVDKIPYQKALNFRHDLEKVISANVGEHEARHPWKALSGNLAACNIFLTSQGVTIRPYLAPTFSHAPFANAAQRIYLSATPGEGGELERVFCRSHIARLTPPAGSERHAIGRRFFVFPERGLDDEEQEEMLRKLAADNRILAIAGDNKTGDLYKEFFSTETSATVFSASDIEASKKVFIKTCPAVAVLANRYDGIDFPGDECRITVLVDIPTAANPQEKFFMAKLAGTRIYDARILTRIIQSFGRCTRSSTDYGIVVVFGDRIVSFLEKKDRQEYFHSELQGELLFGLSESTDTTLPNTLENIGHFLAQDAEWKGAESEIYSLRDSATQKTLPGSSDLALAVVHEVKFVEHLWHGNVLGALESCKAVLGSLTDPSLRGARALWNYFAGSMAARLALEDRVEWEVKAHEHYSEAAKAAPNLSWLHALSGVVSRPFVSGGTLQEETLQLDAIEELFLSLGTSHDRKFDDKEAEVRADLASEDFFERGHVSLGKFLGFDAGKRESQGSPDPWWRCGSEIIIVFEDHAGADEEANPLTITKARQAGSHKNWIKEKLSPPPQSKIVQVLITPKTQVAHDGMCHLHEVFVWPLVDFREWSENALSTIRELRGKFIEAGDLEWRDLALRLLRERGLTANSIIENLKLAANILTEQ